jgi:alcohol dehydrogenase class IV
MSVSFTRTSGWSMMVAPAKVDACTGFLYRLHSVFATFSFPTQIVSGEGALSLLKDQLSAAGVRRPLVVTDAGLLPTPAWQLLLEAVGNAPAVFSGVHPNPLEEDVEAAVNAYRKGDCDGVIGFGGGSALDVAKILRVAVAGDGAGWGALSGKTALGVLAPFIAIPTTAGTGSEVGRSSVITFGHTKRVLFHPALLAKLVLLDPRVTVGLPAKLTAATGVDALTHCIESFTSPEFHPLCDGIALEGARIVFSHLAGAVEEGHDLRHRAMMQIAAVMGGIAFQKDLGAAHSLSHPLSAHFGLNHGLANGLCLPPVMRFNAARKPGVYARLAVATGQGSSDAEFITAVETLLKRIGVTGGLAAQGVESDALEALSEAAFADSCHKTNPVPVTKEELLELYRAAMN